MKRTSVKCFIIVAVLILLAGMIYLTVSHMTEMNRPEKVPPVYHTLTYGVEGEGRIEGETQQTVEALSDGKPIEAVAAEGWHFKGWSDGSTQPSYRQDCRITHAVNAKAIFAEGASAEEWCYLNFLPTKGGRIEGDLNQVVKYGGKGSTVIAIAEEDYRFVKWSDGETEAVRKNLHVTHQSVEHIYAEFERYSRLFTYHYNEATSANTEKNVLITLENLNQISLPVPKREGYRFKGWYSDWHHTLQVTDESGELIVGKEWFQGDWWHDRQINPENHLYAKWEAIKEIPKYKTLLIFVTEVHGDFETNHGKSDVVRVDYVMTELHKRVCMKIAQRFETYLEALLNATVDFEIDTYFTTEPLTRENFYRGSTGFIDSSGETVLLDSYGIDVRHNHIPEVSEMIGDYGSVLTTFCLNDEDHELIVGAGAAGAKFGEIYFEAIGVDYSDEVYFDETIPGVFTDWAYRMELMIHEFTHTVEMQLNATDNYGIHNAGRYYNQIHGPIDNDYVILGPYLRDTYETDEGYVGIPYSFWEGTYERTVLSPSALPEVKANYAIIDDKKYLI